MSSSKRRKALRVSRLERNAALNAHMEQMREHYMAMALQIIEGAPPSEREALLSAVSEDIREDLKERLND